MGRPSDFTEETAARICELIAQGVSLRSICDAEDFPAASTVFKWLSERPAFSEQYARAREAQADAIFDEMLDIADDGRNDWLENRDEEGGSSGWRVNGEHIQRSRLRIEARKWMASKLQPKKYGEKVVNEHGGIDGKPIETVTRIERVIVDPRNTNGEGVPAPAEPGEV
jgi:hypothetical protein